MVKCSLCGNEIRFGQASYRCTGVDGKICNSCQSAVARCRSDELSAEDAEYLKTLINSADSQKNEDFIKELLASHSVQKVTDESESYGNDFNFNMPESTVDFLPGFAITKTLGVVFSECAVGTGMFSEFSAGLSDLFGSKSKSFSKKLATVRDYAMRELRQEAVNRGGNAIIGIKLEYSTFLGNIMGVSVSGTAVIAEPINDNQLTQ